MPYQNFETLEVWKKGSVLKSELYQLAKVFPSDEKFRLADQIIRSSRSVCTQIAEGHGRRTNPDKIRFCVISRGSLAETLNHLIDAFDCAFIEEGVLNEYRLKISELEKLLNGYIAYLEKNK